MAPLLWPVSAWSADVTMPSLGDKVFNPTTGKDETVTKLINPAAVVTDGGYLIFTAAKVDDTYTDPTTGDVMKVTSVNKNGNGDVVSVVVQDTTLSGNPTSTQDIATFIPVDPGSTDDGSGSGFGPVPSLGSNRVSYNVQYGKDGKNGHDGGGVKIFGVCLCYHPGAGGKGAAGPDINQTFGSAQGPFTSTFPTLSGITVKSVGGNGGKGGDEYGNIKGARGGEAGDGGTVKLTNHADITTSGIDAFGILAQSSSGVGGNGGKGYLGGSGGTGGKAGQGGDVSLFTDGTVVTTGTGAIAILAQSLGGSSGNGGSSYGLVAQGGGGSAGGNGGTVSVTQAGSIQTSGQGAHGVMAQSVGGDGGNSGNAIGLLGEGSSAGFGGNGGLVTITGLTGSHVVTTGEGSVGLFGQSIGGGGGNGGYSAGVVALGSKGAGGGDGGVVNVTLQSGATITTGKVVAGVPMGESSHGIFAQSVGGGGGSAGIAGGLVALGSSSDGGGNGGAVTVDTEGVIVTHGQDAKGVFAQSVGGGGGAAQGTGGLVSLGGSGGGGGNGDAVSVLQRANGSITTDALGADAIFAQSVGGGGGAGSASGGLVSLGGSGAGGGAGGSVTVENRSLVETSGGLARGIFAQSVGGGGGAGGDSGGLVSLGGSGSVASVGGAVTVTNLGTILTGGTRSSGLQAQSIGGGGGDGGSSGGAVTIGGSGGAGGDAGVVTINDSGVITTTGVDSHAIFAQSVGGGGGNGGASYSGSAFLGAAIGGEGALGGKGGDVALKFKPATAMVNGAATLLDPMLTTSGARSDGIFAQSVGGGGGNGGLAVQGTIGAFGSVSVAVGGKGGAGGAGGTVDINGNAAVDTSGTNAFGLLAQSVGGGGGNGGGSISVSISGGYGVSASISAAVGGYGGKGGVGGVVDVESGGHIHTGGQFSTGFETQSVGGGGGNGGYSISGAGSGSNGVALSVALGLGGRGGKGGGGGKVTGIFDGWIATDGNDAGAAVIQSIGGGGGNGGFDIAASFAGAGSVSGAASVGLGGAGGDGGHGGQVAGRIGGDVATKGDRSIGVVIQSVGGGGGTGGFNIAGSFAAAGDAGFGLAVGFGGSGGGGGNGGEVAGQTDKTVVTLGSESAGLIVQSIGGGGGAGGFNISGSIGGGGDAGVAASVGFGGVGESGGDGGLVKGHALDTVQTSGFGSSGIVVQSVGGGGGSGAFNVSGSVGVAQDLGGALSVGLGGGGGGGGAGGQVIASARDIFTKGDMSGAFLAQSVGGGGGNGGFNISGGLGVGGDGAGVATVGLGGFGGKGGNASTVDATVVGDVVTQGFGSNGIVAQSMGGGGGNGAFNISGGLSASQDASATIGVGLGGFGGSGGKSDAVSLDVTGTSNTLGSSSTAILAQSVGGGGGSGGFNITGGIAASTGTAAGTVGVSIGGFGGGGGNAGAVTFNMNQSLPDDVQTVVVSTQGNDARGALIQSIGGGGGNGGFSVTGGLSAAETASGNVGVGIGGGGGKGGNGGAVIANLIGQIATLGTNADAIMVESVGGGGGAGGFNVSGGLAGSTKAGGNVMVGVGGWGGTGGKGGAVSGTVLGNIVTAGDFASALTYQSIGGGGGSGGFNVTGSVTFVAGNTGAGTIGLGVGGFGGGGGSSSTVDTTYTGDIFTKGAGSHGVLLQSAAGGGGNGGFNVTGGISFSTGVSGVLGVGIGGFGGGGGSAGAVTGTITGNTVTEGDGAFGAVLQSLGGAGGNGGLNVTGGISLSAGNSSASGSFGIGVGGFGGSGGSASDVTGTVTGLYNTNGKSSLGVMAQSVGGGGGNGGIDITGDVAASYGKTGTMSIGIGVGGFGGDGGTAGNVDLTRVGDTFTSGADSDGVTAMSIGGGGGKGGINVTGNLNVTNAESSVGFALGLGGFGGKGGAAGDVNLAVTGNVLAAGAGARTSTLDDAGNTEMTIPDGSNGVVAQSIGGGGGNGGINVSGQITITKPNSSSGLAGSIGIGGFGGSGGDAGTVTLSMLPPADTPVVSAVATGDDMSAVAAQSIGGGGGNGGINVAGSLSLSGSLAMGVGGFGGAGGLGNDVDATVVANLWASGQNSNGLLAQSIGGGGGAGGINVSGAINAFIKTEAPAISFGVGGFGGTGNASGDVTVDQLGQIVVEGQNSFGILAQSIGGGGGTGGLDVAAAANLAKNDKAYSIAIGIGGKGGTGANAGAVDLTSAGNVFVNAVGTTIDGKTTYADEPYLTFNAGGVVVQSIGGGGGNGGINATAAISPFSNPIAVGVGGFGGDGGDAGVVTVHRGFDQTASGFVADPGAIVALGNGTPGLVAQSIGGGGGTAGMNFTVAASVAPQGDDDVAAQIVVGGDGGDAGNGNLVNVAQNGDITTKGSGSVGLVASSIGGGGGDANYTVGFGFARKANTLDVAIGGGPGSAGVGGAVTVDQTGTINTNGTGSFGLLAQSIGGGGGNTELTLSMSLTAKNQASITIGRHGGTGGTGGDVSVKQTGVISTGGDLSSAIAAESIGGGGGTSSATTIGVTAQGGAEDKKDSYQTSISVGLDGGVAAVSGNVDVVSTGTLSTLGEYSQGIMAQSIGGGGGIGGEATNTLFNNAGGAVVAVGGKGGSGADAGTVTVDTTSTIVTKGDWSEGVVAQSIGGGGGEGGSTRTLNIEFGLPIAGGTNSTENTLAVNVGGKGGTGGDGGAVKVTNAGVIGTSGAYSYGVRAQSIGGGGGTGGAVLNVRVQMRDSQDSNSMSMNIGGAGGTGGVGSTVDVTNTGYISTTGHDAIGIVAQSVGGGGGDGGIVFDASAGTPGKHSNTNSFLMDIGGTGGTGGTGGDVTVTNHRIDASGSGLIITTGDNAFGILGQSIGGGGGNGSAVVQSTAYLTGKDSGLVGLSIGGKGGSGNNAGSVTVTNDGLIQTSGHGAHGIVAQSVGGGGGNGGMSVAANLSFDTTDNTSLMSIGGAGGDGANGGTVVVNNTGSILTTGANANGILAQSIGGGGGNANGSIGVAGGDMNSFILSRTLSTVIGALSGGSGGKGGAVTVNHSGDITVQGKGSQAIVAQSINGGGGTMALDISGVIGMPGMPYVGSGSETITPMPAVTALVGGNGNSGMNAELVTVNATGTFGATGRDGAGGVVQTVGGGGGMLALDLDIAAANSDVTAPIAIPVNVALGGVNGTNNAGGDIAGVYKGTLVTSGADSPAQLMQSVGGGGGRAAIEIAAPQGSLLGPMEVALGGANGQNEAGGAIQFNQTGALVTSGAVSPGALLQSIGGGGGTASIDLQGAGASSAPLALSLGSSGGSGLNGGAISATLSGGIATSGDHSVGLFAQSIGGGGGDIRLTGAVAYDVAMGGTNGASGDGGAVVIANSGTIYTSGVGAHGVFLQSIGGGGGAVFGDPTTVTLNPSNSGNGGDISFTQTGDIVVTGAGADGIAVQSIGGGGGWIDGLFFGSAGGSGSGGAVAVSATGNIEALGADATAIFAESDGGTGQGNITVDVLNPPGGKGLVLGGLGSSDPEGGAGVKLVGGVTNVLNNAGVIGAVPAISGTITGISADDGVVYVLGTNGKTKAVPGTTGYAVVATGGADVTVNNTGLMLGSVDLGTGHNAFNNAARAVFDAGVKVLLGSGNALANAGTLSPGGYGKIATTAITGNLVQTSTGIYGLDLDLKADTTDQITVSGTAAMSGVVHANIDDPLVAPGYALPGTHTKLIMAAAGGLTHSGLALQAFNTAVAGYSLVYPDTTKVDLQYVIDYSPAGLTGNQHAMGDVVNTIQTKQTSQPFRPIATNLFYLPDVPTLGAAYDSLSGEGVAALEQASFDSADQFLAVTGAQVSDWLNAPRAAGQGWHLWLSPFGMAATYGGDANVGAVKVKQSAYGIAGGFDYQITEHALIGIGIGGGETWVNVPKRQTKASTDTMHFGLYGGTGGDDWFFSGAVSYDFYKNVEARIAAIPGVTLPKPQFVDGPYTVPGYLENLGAKYDSASYSGRFEAGYIYNLDVVRAMPFAGLEFGSLTTDGFTETDAGRASQIGLMFKKHDTETLPSFLGIKFDTSTDLGGNYILSGWLKSSWKHEFAINRTTDAEFIAAPDFGLKVHGAQPSRDAAAIDTGVRLKVDDSVTIYANFGGTYGGPNASYAGSAGVNIRW